MLNILVAAALVFYPVLVFFGLAYLNTQTLVIIFVCLLLLRHWVARHQPQRTLPAYFTPVMLAGSMVLLGISAVSDDLTGMRLYPVWINLCLLGVFAYSLVKPPTVIERFARLTESHLSPFALAYIRKVTWVWCGFFIINASLAFYTAQFCSLATWTWYNGAISYLAMGVLFGLEFLVRQWVKKRDPDHA